MGTIFNGRTVKRLKLMSEHLQASPIFKKSWVDVLCATCKCRWERCTFKSCRAGYTRSNKVRAVVPRGCVHGEDEDEGLPHAWHYVSGRRRIRPVSEPSLSPIHPYPFLFPRRSGRNYLLKCWGTPSAGASTSNWDRWGSSWADERSEERPSASRYLTW